MMNFADALSDWQRRQPGMEPGSVWLVGAGPGDPGLLTLHALRALAEADVIVHDALVGREVLGLAGEHAQLEPAGKRAGRPSTPQDAISARLIQLARQGLRVVRLKGGDPFIFGRGGEEVRALAEAKIPYRVIPGISAGLAGLTSAGIPATLRGVNRALVLATGHGTDEGSAALDWGALARLDQPIAFYMALRNLEHICSALLREGLAAATPAALISSATTPQQRVLVTTLGELAECARGADLESPAIVAIGRIVSARDARDPEAGAESGRT